MFFSSNNKYSQDSCDQMGIVATVAGIGGALQGQLLINNVLKRIKFFPNNITQLW